MKYTREQLRAMAARLLKAKTNGDGRFSTFIFSLSIRTGLIPTEIEKQIINFSKAP